MKRRPSSGSHVERVSRITIDTALVRAYTQVEDVAFQQANGGVPFVKTFNHRGKHLSYVAASHGSLAENKTTYELIKQLMDADDNSFKAVVIERFEESGANDAGFKDNAKQKKDNTEYYYAAHLAHEKDITVIAAEPSAQAIFDHMKTRGYSTKDIVCLYILKQIVHEMTDNNSERTEANFHALAGAYLRATDDFKHVLPADMINSRDEFISWYNAHNDTAGKSFAALTIDDLRPESGDDATYFQRMCADIDTLREAHILKQIEAALNTYDSVLVVYGSAHLFKAMDALEAAFEHKERAGGVGGKK